jgi:hypothetical protein
MKKLIINPVGLKGKEIHERQLALMGMTPINENENKKNSAVELTKVGPDGNAYAIIRENHEYYIKKSSKTNGLVLEDFNYIGGLQNKKDEAYPSYAKAIKHLNLKFKSLAEAYGNGGDINVFEDDNLLSERAFGMGFSNQGNMEGMDEMWTEEDEMAEAKSKEAGRDFVGKEISHLMHDKDYPHDRAVAASLNVARDKGYPVEEVSFGDDVEMNEYEMAIDEMINSLRGENTDPEDDFHPDTPFRNEELHGGQHKLDVDKDGDIGADDLEALRARKHMNEEEFQPHGSYTVSNHGGYEVMLSPDGEMAKVRDAYGSDNPETSDWLEIEYVYDEETGESEPVIDPDGYNIPLNMVMRMNEMSAKDKEFAALAEPKDKITYADKIAGANLDEYDSLYEHMSSILKAINEVELSDDDLKKKL